MLVIGGRGLLGREVTRQALGAGLRVVPTGRRDVDIRDRSAVVAFVDRVRPAVLVNAAFQQSDWATTADGAAQVAAAAVSAGARLVHISSDAVFSGLAPSYGEACLPDPIVPYGAAKAAAETSVKALDPGAVIVRTSLIIGNGLSVHERFVHGLASGSVPGVLYTDDVRCPVHVSDLASALLELAGSSYSGVHHVAGLDAVSRYDLGVLIAGRDDLPTGLRAESGLPGPLVVRLDCTMTQSRLTTRLRGAREFLGAAS
jgi:dTDP-4-dehydrorhamnose reductase